MHKQIEKITEGIAERSETTRRQYLQRIESLSNRTPQRKNLSCGNLAHGFAACNTDEKEGMRRCKQANIAIISAYNDLLSAHHPYQFYPAILKKAIQERGGIAQFAGGVPAMCDGITQGQPGMELSLMSRDVIALAASIALSHNLFDGALMLGICDKIVPGLLIAALSFGHLPFIFVPAGPMPSGIPNNEKNRVRKLFQAGQASQEELLTVEAASYHAPGTCTFYGTANSNQLVIELMGLQLPGSSFVAPNMPLRLALTEKAGQRILELSALQSQYLPIGRLLDVKNIVNGIVGLLASGGSTNHTMHLVAIAQAAGYIITWDDFADLSAITPLIAEIYPNGSEDINAFQAAGGMAYFTRTLLEEGLLFEEVETVAGFGLKHYIQEPLWQENKLLWQEGLLQSRNPNVLRAAKDAYRPEGGLKLLTGNLGRAIIKISALRKDWKKIQAPALVFEEPSQLEEAFAQGELYQDCIVVMRFQGPKARGMPELHGLTSLLAVVQDRGYQIALLTDGRMSGASGKIPAAIHVTPEAIDGGPLAKIQNHDLIIIDIEQNLLQVLIPSEELMRRQPASPKFPEPRSFGRELFLKIRQNLSGAEQGASIFGFE